MEKYIDAKKFEESLKRIYDELNELYNRSSSINEKTIYKAKLVAYMDCIFRLKEEPKVDIGER